MRKRTRRGLAVVRLNNHKWISHMHPSRCKFQYSLFRLVYNWHVVDTDTFFYSNKTTCQIKWPDLHTDFV